MTNERLEQIIKFAEGLRQNPKGKDLLKGAIENVRELLKNGEPVERTLGSLEQVQRALNSIPTKGKERNN
jgi:hypothetical protein